MLHTKCRGKRSAGSGEEDFKCAHGGHLGHVTSIMLINFHFLVSKSLHKNLVKMTQWVLESSVNFICK